MYLLCLEPIVWFDLWGEVQVGGGGCICFVLATGLADTAALSAVPAGTQILPELFVPSFDEYEDDEGEKQIVLGAMVKFRYTAKHLPNSIL